MPQQPAVLPGPPVHGGVAPSWSEYRDAQSGGVRCYSGGCAESDGERAKPGEDAGCVERAGDAEVVGRVGEVVQWGEELEGEVGVEAYVAFRVIGHSKSSLSFQTCILILCGCH